VGDRLCFHILATDTHRVIERSVVRSVERSPVNLTMRFPMDEMHPNPIAIEEQDENTTTLEDEELDEPAP
jgi:hypothetical protein